MKSGQFTRVSRWYPHGTGYWLASPRKACRSLGHAPVAIRCLDLSTTALGHGDTVTRWWFEPRARDAAVRIEFVSVAQMRHFAGRWRILADALAQIGRDDPTFACRGVRIDLGDGVGPQADLDLVAFARRPGSRARLIPNPYLLRPRPWLTPAIPWAWKRDTVYFRGASTGARDYDANARVTLCRIARDIPRCDCRLSRLKQVDAAFAARMRDDGIVGRRHLLAALACHRFCVDVDGNSSSWDRYLIIGLMGGLPIRFEAEWEECWHGLLVDGENYVAADRATLTDVVARLRADDARAAAIARRAHETATRHLSRAALRRRLAHVLAGAAGDFSA